MTYMRQYQDCQEENASLGCVAWANHVNILVTAPHGCVALDQEGVRGLVAQLQEWLDK